MADLVRRNGKTFKRTQRSDGTTTEAAVPRAFSGSTVQTTERSRAERGTSQAVIKNTPEVAQGFKQDVLRAGQGRQSVAQQEASDPFNQQNVSKIQDIFSLGQGELLPDQQLEGQTTNLRDNTLLGGALSRLTGQEFIKNGRVLKTSLNGVTTDVNTGEFVNPYTGETVDTPTLTGALPIGLSGGFTGLKALKGKFFPNAQEAVRAGNTAKQATKLKPSIDTLQNLALIVVGAQSFGGFNFNSEVDTGQQALNTVGTTTSTIVGQSTNGVGDWREGLKELRQAENTILYLEERIKEGKIRNATLKLNGKILDIDADIQDQLLTVREGITDIERFAISQQFPEMSDEETEAYLSQLEKEGYIQRTGFEESRRLVLE